MALEQRISDALREQIYNAVLNALSEAGFILPPREQGLPSTTPPGSPRLLPKELGFVSAGGISHPRRPGGIPHARPGAVDHEARRPRTFSELPVSTAPPVATQHRAIPGATSSSKPPGSASITPCHSRSERHGWQATVARHGRAW